jgi:hypothetical protein
MNDSVPMLFVYDAKTEVKRPINFDYKYSFRHYNMRLSAYSNMIYANKDNGVIVVAFVCLDMINFYDRAGVQIKSVRFSKVVSPKESDNHSMVSFDARLFSGFVYGTKNYLYVQRPEASMTDIRQGRVKEVKILKFDWSGNLLTVYKINSYIKEFCVNENTDRLYTVIKTDDPEFAKIVVFDLSTHDDASPNSMRNNTISMYNLRI